MDTKTLLSSKKYHKVRETSGVFTAFQNILVKLRRRTS